MNTKLSLMLKKFWTALSFGMFFGWLFLWAYSAYTHIAPNSNKPSIKLLETKEECNLQTRDCNFKLPSGSEFKINFSQRPVSPNRQTDIILNGEDSVLQPFAIDFNGAEMEMGYNRSDFSKVKPNTYKGKFILPTCSTKTFKWRAILLFKDREEKIVGVPFYFDVNQN
ncbi:MAG: hypothetical protein KBF99_19065 [Leptospiraceae bacterium]|jgi:hypothetical protein|nr:hypothetical protein [Leptospiraceae bacterium]MBK9501627.1 hypothetical protein [Leptospiraceae bacterium]MBP9165290.1 hypothetical protein [Leptospiraceae bacterium]